MTVAEPIAEAPVLSDAEKRSNRRFVIAFGVTIGLVILSITATFFSLRATAAEMRTDRDTIIKALNAVHPVPRALESVDRDAVRDQLDASDLVVRFSTERIVIHNPRLDQYYEVSLAPTETAWTVRRTDRPRLFDQPPAQP